MFQGQAPDAVDDGCPACFVTELDMAAPLADLLEANLLERSNRVLTGGDRDARAHAAISTDAIIGGSDTSGTGASSK